MHVLVEVLKRSSEQSGFDVEIRKIAGLIGQKKLLPHISTKLRSITAQAAAHGRAAFVKKSFGLDKVYSNEVSV